MTKDPPENETAAQAGTWCGGDLECSSKSLTAHSTCQPTPTTALRAYVLDARLVVIEARFG